MAKARKKDKGKKPVKRERKPFKPKVRGRDMREAALAKLKAQEDDLGRIIVKLGKFREYSASFHCARVQELGAQGASEAQMAVDLGMSRSKLKRWRREYEEFGEAVQVALTLAEAYWESRQVSRMDMFGHNANAYKHVLGSRFRETYGEKVQLSGDEDAPIRVITRRIIDPKRREDDAP